MQQHSTLFKEQHADASPTAAQHLLNRHSSPGSFDNSNSSSNNNNQSVRVRHPQHGAVLLTSPSILPGPRYPFPSQAQAAAGGLQGVLRSLLKPFKRAHARTQSYSWLDWLQVFLPCVKWLRTYRIKEYLLWDIIAGISVGFMVVPQGMSYANIAGVPSVYGLYGAFLPVLVYAVFGSSKELAVGPVAVTSLLISSSLKEVVPGSIDITNPNNPPAELVPVQAMYNHRAIQLSLLVACMYTAVGATNLGFLTNFLSHSVIGGFTSGAAIIIGMSQLKYILGFNISRADKLYEQIHLYIEGIGGFVWQEYVMGMSLLTMLLTIKFYGKRYPRLKWLRPIGPISACVVAIIAVVAGNLQDKGIKIVGNIPAGLPAPTVSWWLPMPDAAKLAPLALVVMVVDLLESTSIARALAAKCKYELNANQEIVGLGLANFAGSAFNAYSTTGSFSRSAVNYDSGAKTGLSGFVTGCVVGLVLLFMTPVFEKLPLNVMGAIVISGVSGLFEYEEAVHLFKIRKLDWAVWMCSFLSTMFLGVEIGLAISIGLALMIVIYESAFPHTALLGRVGRTTIYRNVKQFPDSQVIPGIAACRVDAPIYFANVAYIHERLRKYVSRAEAYSEAAGTRLQFVLLDMSPVTHLDTTGATLLEKVYDELQQQNVQLGLCNPVAAVVALLERTGFPDLLGREWVFVRMHDAVQTCLAAMISDGQAVRPLSAYSSQALTDTTPRAGRAAGPGPLLFHPPGRGDSPTGPPRRSAPSAPGLGSSLQQHFLRRRSLDGAGTSPLLPRKHAGAHGDSFSPLSPGAALGGLSSFDSGLRSGIEQAAAAATSGGSRARPDTELGLRLSTAGGATGDPQQAPSRLQGSGSSSSSSGGGGRGGQHTHMHSGGQHYVAEQQPDAYQQDHLELDQQHLAIWAAAAHAQGPSQHSTHRATPPAAAAAGPFSAASTLLARLPGPPPPPVRVSSARQSADGSWPAAGDLARAQSFGPLPPPVTLGGLHLHINPSVLHHPAVLSRTQSSAGERVSSVPLSRSGSQRRAVSPRTEQLFDEVFSASNGDEFLAAATAAGSQSPYSGAMLQLTELGSDGSGTGFGGGQQGLPQGAATGASGTAGQPGAAAAQEGEVRLLLGHPKLSRDHTA